VKDIAFQLRGEYIERMVFAAATLSEGKPALMLILSDDLVNKGINAALIVREAAKQIQGGGGGQAYFATAGGKNTNGLSSALDAMIEKITGMWEVSKDSCS